jgi:hypothetical protein
MVFCFGPAVLPYPRHAQSNTINQTMFAPGLAEILSHVKKRQTDGGKQDTGLRAERCSQKTSMLFDYCNNEHRSLVP